MAVSEDMLAVRGVLHSEVMEFVVDDKLHLESDLVVELGVEQSDESPCRHTHSLLHHVLNSTKVAAECVRVLVSTS